MSPLPALPLCVQENISAGGVDPSNEAHGVKVGADNVVKKPGETGAAAGGKKQAGCC